MHTQQSTHTAYITYVQCMPEYAEILYPSNKVSDGVKIPQVSSKQLCNRTVLIIITTAYNNCML